jgi:uncharacterized protein (TIGR02246 family)
MNETNAGPESVIDSVAQRIGAGDLEGALALYEDDAAFLPEPGRVVAGRDRIRAELEGLIAMRPTITGEIEKVVTAGDTALVINDWALRGTDPAGDEIAMAARSADVLRRRRDGSWGIVIDDPWGA